MFEYALYRFNPLTHEGLLLPYINMALLRQATAHNSKVDYRMLAMPQLDCSKTPGYPLRNLPELR